MDWMSSYYPEALAEEWDAISERATADARALFSAARIAIPATSTGCGWATAARCATGSNSTRTWRPRCSLRDRVHTYAGFHIADIAA